MEILDKLAKSKFRSRFKLRAKELEYIKDKGLDTIHSHACDFIRERVVPAAPRDNAPIESFFGHLKDELDYKKCKTFEELSALVDDYMYNYNYTRKQWSKNKMTPMEYKRFLLVS